MDATVPCGYHLSYHLLWFVHWCLLQDTPQEDSEVGIRMEISLLQALFMLFPDFSNRCFLVERWERNECLSVTGKGFG